MTLNPVTNLPSSSPATPLRPAVYSLGVIMWEMATRIKPWGDVMHHAVVAFHVSGGETNGRTNRGLLPVLLGIVHDACVCACVCMCVCVCACACMRACACALPAAGT